MSEEDVQIYNKDYVNIVSVARLSVEKGIDRAIGAISSKDWCSNRWKCL